MSWRNWCIAAALVLALLVAFPAKRSHSSAQVADGTRRSEQATGVAAAPLSAPAAASHARPRRTDGPLSTYHNPEYGMSFQYPRNYALDEGETDEGADMIEGQTERELGETLLATVWIPDDAYPNTNFEHGSLQALVNDSVDEEGCRELIATGESTHRLSTFTTAQGLSFWRSVQTSSADETQTIEREYAGFFSGRCYVFHAEAALGDLTSQEGTRQRPVDAQKVFRQLETIVANVRLESAGSAESVAHASGAPRL